MSRATVRHAHSWGPTAERLIGNSVPSDAAIRIAMLEEAVAVGAERRAGGDHRIPEMDWAEIVDNGYRSPEHLAGLIEQQSGRIVNPGEIPDFDSMVGKITVTAHGDAEAIRVSMDADIDTRSNNMLGKTSDVLSDVGKRAGIIGGAVLSIVAAGAASASEIQEGSDLEDAAWAAAGAIEETNNPYTKTANAAFRGDADAVTNNLVIETVAIGGELGGGAVGGLVGAVAGSVVPGPGTAVGAIVGGIGGSIVGAEVMQGIAEDMLGPGEVPHYMPAGASPGDQLFSAYYDVQTWLAVDPPPGAEEITGAFREIQLMEKVEGHIRLGMNGSVEEIKAIVEAQARGEDVLPEFSFPNMVHLNEAESLLEQAQSRYITAFENMDINVMGAHVAALEARVSETLEEAGLTGDVTLPDGRTMDMADALSHRESFEILYNHFRDAGNHDALHAMNDHMVVTQLRSTYSQVEMLYHDMAPAQEPQTAHAEADGADQKVSGVGTPAMG